MGVLFNETMARLVFKQMTEWAKGKGRHAAGAALKEIVTDSSADVIWLLSCLPVDILDEARRRAQTGD